MQICAVLPTIENYRLRFEMFKEIAKLDKRVQRMLMLLLREYTCITEYPHQFLAGKSKIYDNGGSEIYA